VKKYLLTVALFVFYTLICNFSIVYFSPRVIPWLPSPIVNRIDPCYRTFIHTNFFEKYDKQHFVLGDSYVEGAGDEWLEGVKDYGFVKKLDNPNSFAVFGRGGFGSMSALNEVVACSKFINRYTTAELNFDKVENVIIGFYEGNDLNNNLWERSNLSWLSDFSRQRTGELLLPLFDILRELPSLASRELMVDIPPQVDRRNSIKGYGDVPEYVQGPGLELTASEFLSSIDITRLAISKSHELFPKARIIVLYLASPGTLNSFDAPIKLQAYKAGKYLEVTRKDIMLRHEDVKMAVTKFCLLDSQCEICDTTDALSQSAKNGRFVHGPKDWNHLNRIGYTIVSEELKKCLGY
jgi:hypothetical protein